MATASKMRQNKSARVLIETSNLRAPLVAIDVGVMTTVLMTKTVLLASCVVVWDERLTTLGVLDETVDETVDGVVDGVVDEVVDVLGV